MAKIQWDVPKKKTSKFLIFLLVFVGLIALAVAVYFIPPVHERLSWRVTNLRTKIYYFFNPPGETAFNPAQQEEMKKIVNMTQTAMAPEPTATVIPSLTPTNYVSPTPTQTASPIPSPTKIPDSVKLEGVVWQNQKFFNNYCGPANLSMALSYWDWDGDQTITGPWLKPHPEDRNVMPYEMVDYVLEETELSAKLRWGGDLEILKKFIAAGFPVLIEKGFEEEVPQGGWMGHYGVITGYDDANKTVLIQDSFVKPDYIYSYDRVLKHWQEFNYVYIVIYPPEFENEINTILGPQSDEKYNFEYTAQKALEETQSKQGRELFFAWYNYGTSLMLLNDYYGSAVAYDNAFDLQSEIYKGAYPFYRILWYQTGPYFAYYYTGRYQDLIDLADLTLSYSYRPAIEETWVWRGRARVAIGDIEGAIEDFRAALEWHPGWWVAEDELRLLEVTP
jgi:tetratricopeptide (TPR) repeat protein